MKIGIELRLGTGDAGELFADARRLRGRGRFTLGRRPRRSGAWVIGPALAAATSVRLVVAGGANVPWPCDPRAAVAREARRRVQAPPTRRSSLTREGAAERWTFADMPAGRAEWKALCAQLRPRDFAGLLPNNPRLLDLVRSPDAIRGACSAPYARRVTSLSRGELRSGVVLDVGLRTRSRSRGLLGRTVPGEASAQVGRTAPSTRRGRRHVRERHRSAAPSASRTNVASAVPVPTASLRATAARGSHGPGHVRLHLQRRVEHETSPRPARRPMTQGS